MIRFCAWCDAEIQRRKGEAVSRYSRRRFCSLACRYADQSLRYRTSAEGRAADVEQLLGFGESPWSVAGRLGIKPDSVGRSLERYGRTDLACVFYRAGRADRSAAA